MMRASQVSMISGRQGSEQGTRGRAARGYQKNFVWLTRYRGFLASNLYAAFWMLFLTRTLKVPLYIAFDLVTLTFLLSIVAEFPTGYIADRFSRKRSMLIGTALCMLGLGICACATSGTYWIVVPGIIIDEIGSSLAAGPDDALANESAHALAGKTSREQFLDRYNNSRTNYVALLRGAGGVIGGLLAVHFGLRSTVWAQVVAYGIAYLFALRVVVPLVPEARSKVSGQGVGTFWEVTKEIMRTRALVAIILYNGAMLGLTQFSYNFLSIYFSKVRIDGASLSLGWFGIVWSAYMVSPWIFRRKPIANRFLKYYIANERVTLFVMALLAAVSIIVAGIWISIPGLLALLGMYYANAMQQPRMATARTKVSRREIQSSTASAAQFIVILVAGLFSLLTSVATRQYSFGTALVCVGILFSLIACTGLVLMNKRPNETGIDQGSALAVRKDRSTEAAILKSKLVPKNYNPWKFDTL